MTGCNATLTTATVEPCDDGPRKCPFPDSLLVVDDRHSHVAIHTLNCKRHDPDHIAEDTGHWCKTDPGANSYTEWRDSTPGARPHTPPLVSDAEVQAAWREITGSGSVPPTRTDISRALAAAAEVRQEAGER